jgi:predicted ATP-dependent serine protease
MISAGRRSEPVVMAKAKTVYRCTECGAEFPKWAGRCESCDAWNTLGEELVIRVSHHRRDAPCALCFVSEQRLLT